MGKKMFAVAVGFIISANIEANMQATSIINTGWASRKSSIDSINQVHSLDFTQE